MFTLPTVSSAIAPLNKIIKNLLKVRAAHDKTATNKADEIVRLVEEVKAHTAEKSAADRQVKKIESLIN